MPYYSGMVWTTKTHGPAKSYKRVADKAPMKTLLVSHVKIIIAETKYTLRKIDDQVPSHSDFAYQNRDIGTSSFFLAHQN